MEKNWLIEFDYLRFFAILGVICIHVFYFPSVELMNVIGEFTVNPILLSINNYIRNSSCFGVPLFIAISGFILSLHYYSTFNIPNFLTKRLSKIIPPYLIFSFISIVGLAFFTGFPDLITIFDKLITATANDTLWFFSLIIQFYILYPLIVHLYQFIETQKKVTYLLVICLITQTGVNFLFNIILDPAPNLFLKELFLRYVFYFILGIYIQRNYAGIIKFIKTIHPIYFIPIPVFLSLIHVLPFNTGTLIQICLELVYIVAMMALLLRISIECTKFSSKPFKFIRKVGLYSFGIYLIHPVINYLVIIFLYKIGVNYANWYYYLIIFLSLLFFSYTGVHLITKIPYGEYIIGVKEVPKEIIE